MRKVVARPECEPEAGLQIEERDGAVLELLPDDAVGPEPQAIAVEAHGPLEIVDADGQDRNTRLHEEHPHAGGVCVSSQAGKG